MPRKNLQINLHPTLPFRSSNLALPPSPFTPRLPLTSPPTPPRPSLTRSSHPASNGISRRTNHLPSPPAAPLKWVWQCHICHRQYKLGVTRRCLDDGHYFCAGTTVIKRKDGGRRIKKHKACGSEFDYKGWKEWNTWRRKVINSNSTTAVSAFDSDTDSDGDVFMGEADEEDGDETTNTQSAVSPLFGSLTHQQQKQRKINWFGSSKPASTTMLAPEPLKIDRRGEKNCWNHCDYPSECRWGKAYGVPTPATATFPVPPSSTTTVDIDLVTQTAPAPHTDFKDILVTLEQQAVVADTIDGVAESSNSSIAPLTTTASTTKTAFTDLASLVQSARRRKSRSEIQGPSPLSSSSSSSSSASSSSPLASSLPLTSRFTENISDLGIPTTTTTATSFEKMRLYDNDNVAEEGEVGNDAGAEGARISSGLARALDEFEFDFRRGMERASGLFGGIVGRGSGGKGRKERGGERG